MHDAGFVDLMQYATFGFMAVAVIVLSFVVLTSLKRDDEADLSIHAPP